MTAVDLDALVTALTKIAEVLELLGIPGLVALVLLGPALVLCALIMVEYHRSRRVQESMEAARAEARAVLNIYREDTRRILHDLGEGIQQNVQFYRNNVELVKEYEKLSKNLQDVVVSNTRATERLIVMLEERNKKS